MYLINIIWNVGFEIFTAVTMKNDVFWGVAPCKCGRLNRRFGGSYRHHLQGRKIFIIWNVSIVRNISIMYHNLDIYRIFQE
jgi:hypothetical protein